MKEQLSKAIAAGRDVALEVVADHELLALQGPRAMEVLSTLLTGADADLTKMPFMTGRTVTLVGAPCHLTRCGYTGEDGFEVSVPANSARELWDALTSHDAVRPAGLGARDSLRLEAGLCLYGNDIDETTTPVEAAISWTIAKRRREEGGFLGADRILAQLRDG
eukprot:IDg16837t1